MGLLSDLRFAWRQLWRAPGFTVVALVALALGIGVNTAMFSVVESVLLQPLPFAHSRQLVNVYTSIPSQGVEENGSSYPTLQDWKQRSGAIFSGLGGFRTDEFTLTGHGQPIAVQAAYVTAGFFRTFGVRPVRGRGITSADHVHGGRLAVVVSYRFWQQEFGGRPDLVGQTLALNGRDYTVAGIMPAGFAYPIQRPAIQAWAAEENDTLLGGSLLTIRGAHYLDAVARLRPGVTRRKAEAAMAAIQLALGRKYGGDLRRESANVVAMKQAIAGGVRPALLMLLAAVAFVLLIACANVANLLLARGAVRQRELSLRLALGASRGRLTRQLLTESILLALIGGAGGVLLAGWALAPLARLGADDLPNLPAAGLSWPVLLFTLGVAILTGLIFGAMPAWQASRTDPQAALKEGGRSGAAGARSRARNVLVVAEVAMTLVLLAGAGLLIVSFWRLENAPTGFRRPSHLLTAQMEVPKARYPDAARQRALAQALVARMAALPGARQAAIVTVLPLSGSSVSLYFSLPGVAAAAASHHLDAVLDAVSPRYFATMGVPLLAGRRFTRQDGPGATPVAIINATLARRFFPHENPIGHALKIGAPAEMIPLGPAPRRIVGVVADSKYSSLAAPAGLHIYVPYAQTPLPFLSPVVRTAGPAAAAEPDLRDAIHAVDPNLLVANLEPMSRIIGVSLSAQRFNFLLLTLFAGLAVILAAVGIYGVIAYTVTQRTGEIGVRMALGAPPQAVRRMVLWQGLRLGLIGAGIGLVAAAGLTRLLSSLLFGVSALDPWTFAAVTAAMLVLALAASYIPARRASRIAPLEALRYE
ncbi:MAG: ABC transporter permease [Terriglobales bacterium]